MRPPTARSILRNGRALSRSPHFQNRIDQRPRRFNVIAAIKQRRISAHAIIDQCGVRAARRFAKSFFIFEIHIHVADAHFRSGPLGHERYRNAFIGLDVQHQAVRLEIAFTKNHVRRAAKFDNNFRVALGSRFPVRK